MMDVVIVTFSPTRGIGGLDHQLPGCESYDGHHDQLGSIRRGHRSSSAKNSDMVVIL
jgi:hypothetical protein